MKLLTSDNKLFGKIRSVFGYTLPFLLTVILLYVTVIDVNFRESLNHAANISIFWFVIYLIVFLLSHYVRAIRWKVILNSVKPDTSKMNLFGATMVGYGVNCVVPRLGELYRPFFAGRWEGLSRTSMVGTVILERVIDLLVLGFSVLASIIIYSGDLFSDVIWLKSTLVIGFSGITLIILMLFLLIRLREKFVTVIVKLFNKFSHKLADKVEYVLHTLIEGFNSLKGVKNYFYTIFYSILIMLLYGLNAYLAMLMIGMDQIANVNYGMAWVVMTVAAFGIIIPTPGGTGSYHLIVKTALVTLYGFSEEMGFAYAIVTHTISYIVFISSMLILINAINIRRQKLGFPKENFFSVFKTNYGE